MALQASSEWENLANGGAFEFDARHLIPIPPAWDTKILSLGTQEFYLRDFPGAQSGDIVTAGIEDGKLIKRINGRVIE